MGHSQINFFPHPSTSNAPKAMTISMKATQERMETQKMAFKNLLISLTTRVCSCH